MKNKYKLALATVIAISFVFFGLSMVEKVAKQGDTVSVDYWLEVDGEQIDTSEGRGVFEFTLGAGKVIPGFDRTVTGMAIGEEKTVELSGTDAYMQGPLAGKILKFRVILRDIQ